MVRRTKDYALKGFGAALRAARLQRVNAHGRPWSQYDLADHIGVRASSVSRIESGEAQPSSATLLLILELFPELREVVGADLRDQGWIDEMAQWLLTADKEARRPVLEAYERARKLTGPGVKNKLPTR